MSKPIFQIYLASGWFDPAQKKAMEEMNDCLKALKSRFLGNPIVLFRPFYDGTVLKVTDPKEKWTEVFNLDVTEIRNSSLMVASTCGDKIDMGTIFEIGYAYANNVPCILYVPPQVKSLNLMLAESSIGFARSPQDLLKCLDAFCINYLCGEPTKQVSDWKGEPI